MLARVITLGCKVNEYESQSIMNQLRQNGYEVEEGLGMADIYVVNTCAVTNIAERKSRQTITKILKLNENAKIVVVGCASQNNPGQFLKSKNVLALTGNAGKNDIMKFINSCNKVLPDLEHFKFEDTARPIETRTRQYIKIQDGCDYFCSYCLIPYVRGRSRSRDMNDILDEISNTKANEIVLTGINMSDYKQNNERALKQLVREIDKLGKRFRISSIECMVLDEEMIDILKNCKNFCPHFHLSLQSACNETLKRMNRHYNIEQFKEIVSNIRKVFDNPCISTDVIVGFKGETDTEFEDTYNNLRDIKFDFMHIFPYSERAGTVAARLPNAVDSCVVKEREGRLIELNINNRNDFFNRNTSTVHKVLIEEVDQNMSLGYTDNYIYTYIDGVYEIGSIVEVELQKPYILGMKGKIKES